MWIAVQPHCATLIWRPGAGISCVILQQTAGWVPSSLQQHTVRRAGWLRLHILPGLGCQGRRSRWTLQPAHCFKSLERTRVTHSYFLYRDQFILPLLLSHLPAVDTVVGSPTSSISLWTNPEHSPKLIVLVPFLQLGITGYLASPRGSLVRSTVSLEIFGDPLSHTPGLPPI